MMQKSEAVAGEPQHGQRMIFTGPDGIGDYRPRSNYFPRYIGVGASSPEATGDLSYLWRAAPHGPPPVPRQSSVGEVGWGWQYNQLLNSRTLLSNMQIKKTELRTALEDRVTHRFQNKQNTRRLKLYTRNQPDRCGHCHWPKLSGRTHSLSEVLNDWFPGISHFYIQSGNINNTTANSSRFGKAGNHCYGVNMTLTRIAAFISQFQSNITQ